ncbi:DNA polymerase III subunit gamma/tau [Prochlorococcus marinus]|uniref:DNA polymerase III subunit gamma/tau n=1 Tax=Prochlorococcus marinus XMU1408 TaxID=2213228 RepID=A0A318R038_PROMR|nr:DNA polymerase III subunit gamma/tau [Prochlorococcus marinus]MBW3042907.1 DNA polymerase III subunit gamma/tau [Prochlorococcus marinus str. XMU1408]PYE00333.1 DNA polymerase III subunit gamma/tau [Prochlorococcus marinus XMU1408]
MIKAYEPLHHKYRPSRFDELVGQDPITSTLKQALTSNRIAPAYIFSGPRGTGKTSSARIFAKSLNCLKSVKATTVPCGECELCQGINSGNALDIIEIDAASNTGVENIRELIERARFAPVKARWKVYVIDECHMLSTAAFNALLKTLEEPPPQVVFILATTDPQRVLPTILSRCMRFDFRRISLNDLKNHLSKIATKEGILINEEAILLIAKHSQGGLRDAESLLDQVSLFPPPITQANIINLIGAVPEEELIQLAKSLINKDPNSILETCNSLINKGKEPNAILQGIASILRDLVIKKVANNNNELCNISQENSEGLKALANSTDLNQILNLQAKLKGSENFIRSSNQPKLWLEIQLLGMMSYETSKEKNTIKQSFLEQKKSKDSEVVNSNKISEEINSNRNQQMTQEIFTKKESQLNDEKNNLDDIWEKVIAMLELPSTKMLLSQQAKLINLNSESAEIAISGKWINMIQSRKNLIEDAFFKARGSSTKIILIQQKDKSSTTKVDKDISKKIEKKDSLTTNAESKKIDLDKKRSIQEKDTLDQDSIDKKAKQFAEFFNGEIVNLE